MGKAYNRRRLAGRTGSVKGIESELFVAGVLALVVMVAAVRAFLPEHALAALGVAAFITMLALGAWRMRAAQTARPGRDALMLGVIAALAIVWIAAGQFYKAGL